VSGSGPCPRPNAAIEGIFVIRFGLVGCGRIAKRHSELLGGSHMEGPFKFW
jgi:hypothetical protein